MNPAQIELIRATFHEIRAAAGPLSVLFYGRLFELDPRLRPMFHQDIAVQGRKLMDMLTSIVDHLDHLDSLTPALRALGQRHVAYGVRPEHYAMLSRAFLWALAQSLEAEFYPDVKAAWSAVLETISSSMKEGAAELPPCQ
jgi:hemoglobin-like flavoprotein